MRDSERTRFLERVIHTTRADLPEAQRGRLSENAFWFNVSEVVQLLLSQGDNEILIADTESAPNVGQVWLGTARDPYSGETGGYVYDLHIEPEWRGQGIGRALMRAAEKASRARGDKTLGLAVAVWNDAARALYESLGFESERLTMSKTLTDGDKTGTR